MKKITILIPVIGLFLFSCDNASNEKSEDLSEIETHDEHHHDDESEAIELNNGEKWRVANFQFDIRANGDKMIQSILTLIKNHK